ncbi:response regulator [Poseidonocella sp. HB161398]|uniref:response regulator n=1 Tax=Poseidonocella sp. HB161398 TaxID=2320855 RepID=UPI00110830BC|nr:response regulator transcription factor [Poseidonocella sp. HB161398]
MDRHRLMIVEDDPEIRVLLTDYLGGEGFDVTAVTSGSDLDAALARLRPGGGPDIVILDIMLPGEDGLSICRRLRRDRPDLAILMLTARRDDVDRIVGLELGADDYLCKPFNPRELLARIRAILRRAAAQAAPPARRQLRLAGLVVDLDARQVLDAGGTDLGLTTAEFDLLACFLDRPRRVLTRDLLLDLTRGRDHDPFDRTIDVTMSRLRARLAPALPGGLQLIRTVRNAGYLLTVAADPA